MKILICQFGNETNTFATGRTTFDTLVPHGWIRGDEVLSRFRGTSSYLGGAIRALDEAGVESVPIDLLTNGGNFGAGPLMSTECATHAMDHICEQIAECEGQFEGIYFAMHGGGSAENAEDLEAYTLQRIRDVVGSDIPVMCSLDLHGNISSEMVALADGLFGIKTCPHMDCAEAGYLAAKNLVASLQGQCKPIMALRRLPLLIAPTVGCSLNEPAISIKEYFEQYVTEKSLIDATFFYGFAAADVFCSSASVLVIADGYVPDEEADELASFVWQRHEEFKSEPLSPAQALDRALKLGKGNYVVINEASDNPGGGCPGDGTHLLREMIKRDLPGCIMGPIYDPETAKELHQYRVGDLVSITLGGKTDPLCGDPLVLDGVRIMNLSDGNFISAAPINKGVAMAYGKSARCRSGNVEFIVVSVRFQVYDDRPFLMTGADVTQYRIIGLKSMNHFRGYFKERADALVTTDPPGLCPSDLNSYDYRMVVRPIFPLDTDVRYSGIWPEQQ